MLACVLCWSTSGLFIKFIDWHPMVIAGLRSGIAALCMLLVQRGSLFAGVSPRSPDGKPPQGAPGMVLLLAAACFSAGTKILYVTANKLTSPANAILLHHSAPVWAAFLGWFLIGERPGKRQWVSLAVVCAGVLLFFVNGLKGGSLAGDGVALAAGICFGAAMVFLRMNREGSPAFCLFLSHGIPFTLGLPFIITYPPVVTPASAGAMLFLGMVQVGIASLLYAYSIKRLRALDAVFIAQVEPVLNPVWVFLFSGEVPAPLSMLGGLIIIGAVLMSQTPPVPRFLPRKPSPFI
ncbi:MAG: DMT family transporter [Spirochaetaceae bacterium]|nr:DMT family transporter [Spirochaetaceae bacterium]